MSLAKMSYTAQAIVRARCVGNFTGWDAGDIWTFTTFDVEELWRGSVPMRSTVRLLGGGAGKLTSSVAGVPRFQPGEELVLFIEGTGRGDFTVVSWKQGTFRIRRDARSGAEMITQDSASFETFDTNTRQFANSGIANVPVGLFRARVDAALRPEPGRKQ